MQELVLRGKKIETNQDGLICLDDIWRAARSPVGKAPANWRKRAEVTELQIALYERLYKSQKYEFSKIIKQVAEPQRTFGHPILAVGYASYLNAKLAVEIKEIWVRYAQADPTLADDILSRASEEANEWAGTRALSRVKRREYTDTLQVHGVRGSGYGKCTDAIYEQILGGPAWKVRQARQLEPKVNLRNEISVSELTFVMASESLAKDRIHDEDSRGNLECSAASGRSAFFIKKAIEEDKADRRRQRLL